MSLRFWLVGWISLFEFEETLKERDGVAWTFPDDDLHGGASYRYGDSTVYAVFGMLFAEGLCRAVCIKRAVSQSCTNNIVAGSLAISTEITPMTACRLSRVCGQICTNYIVVGYLSISAEITPMPVCRLSRPQPTQKYTVSLRHAGKIL